MRNTLNYAIAVICGLLFSCQKPSEVLPPAHPNTVLPDTTKIGANTFGCYINGELFVAQSNNYNKVIPTYCSYNSISENELRIQGSRLNDSLRDNIAFKIFMDEVGEYEMVVIGDSYTGYVNIAFSSTSPCFDFDHDSNNPGKVFITHLDTIKRVISGTFEMDLINEDCVPNVLHITDGRFDLKY
ncbi:MAG: hypothetical protein R3279_08495 [Putridiphycobacter sp.]|nr:hypothetical protein [Putridiphycobacter sp.]